MHRKPKRGYYYRKRKQKEREELWFRIQTLLHSFPIPEEKTPEPRIPVAEEKTPEPKPRSESTIRNVKNKNYYSEEVRENTTKKNGKIKED